MADETKVTETENVEKETKGSSKKAATVEPVFEYEIQLKVHEYTNIPVRHDIKRVVVKNLGGGDAYLDDVEVKYVKEQKLAPGETREFKDVSFIHVRSASRPTLKVSMFNK